MATNSTPLWRWSERDENTKCCARATQKPGHRGKNIPKPTNHWAWRQSQDWTLWYTSLYVSGLETSGVQSCKGQQKMCLGWTETIPQMLQGQKGFLHVCLTIAEQMRNWGKCLLQWRWFFSWKDKIPLTGNKLNCSLWTTNLSWNRQEIYLVVSSWWAAESCNVSSYRS